MAGDGREPLLSRYLAQEYSALGGGTSVLTDLCVITASHRALRQGSFRWNRRWAKASLSKQRLNSLRPKILDWH